MHTSRTHSNEHEPQICNTQRSKCVYGNGRDLTLASTEKLKCPQASHRGHEMIKNSMNNKHNNSRPATKVSMVLKHDPSYSHATRQEISTFYVTLRLLTVFIKTHHLNVSITSTFAF